MHCLEHMSVLERARHKEPFLSETSTRATLVRTAYVVEYGKRCAVWCAHPSAHSPTPHGCRIRHRPQFTHLGNVKHQHIRALPWIYAQERHTRFWNILVNAIKNAKPLFRGMLRHRTMWPSRAVIPQFRLICLEHCPPDLRPPRKSALLRGRDQGPHVAGDA